MTKPIQRTIFTIFVLFLIFSRTFGRDIYVDNLRGNDAFLGYSTRATNENGPVRTIRRALSLAQASDCIILANNPEMPYKESVILSGEKHSGVPGFPFKIVGNGATIDGTAEITPTFWHAVGQKGIFVYQPRYKAYQNLFYRGKPVRRMDVTEVKSLQELVNLDWKPMRWCLYKGNVFFKPRETYMIHADGRYLPYDDSVAAQKRAYSLTAPEKQYGITLAHVRYVEISDVIIQGFQNDGISASDTALYVSLNGITCRGNARTGINVGSGCSVWLKDCVLGNNQVAQLMTEEASLVSIFSSDLISYPAPAWVSNGGTVYRDKKEIKGGINEPVGTVFEDEEGYFDEPNAGETDLQETELPEEAEIADETDDEDTDDGGLFGGDDDDSDDSDDTDDGGLFGGDDDDEGDDDSEGDGDGDGDEDGGLLF